MIVSSADHAAASEADVKVAAEPASVAAAAAAASAPAKTEVAAIVSGDDENVAGEMVRFSRLLTEYSNVDHIKNRAKRTGWARMRPGYKIFCCGNSAEDLCIIASLFLVFYTCIALFFWLLLEFYMSTQQDSAALYTFAGIIGAGWLGLLTTVACGERAVAVAAAKASHDHDEDVA